MYPSILCIVMYGMIKFMWCKFMRPALDSHNLHKFVTLQYTWLYNHPSLSLSLSLSLTHTHTHSHSHFREMRFDIEQEDDHVSKGLSIISLSAVTDLCVTFLCLIFSSGVIFQGDGQCPHSGCRGRRGNRGRLWLGRISHSLRECKGHWSIATNWSLSCK